MINSIKIIDTWPLLKRRSSKMGTCTHPNVKVDHTCTAHNHQWRANTMTVVCKWTRFLLVALLLVCNLCFIFAARQMCASTSITWIMKRHLTLIVTFFPLIRIHTHTRIIYIRSHPPTHPFCFPSLHVIASANDDI